MTEEQSKDEQAKFWGAVYAVALVNTPAIEYNESGLPVAVKWERRTSMAAEVADEATKEWKKRWAR